MSIIGSLVLFTSRLCVNLEKTFCMIFFRDNHIEKLIDDYRLKIVMNIIVIIKISCVKFLGIFVDDRLSFTDHINNLVKKLEVFVVCYIIEKL